jgi:hypothetical protein
MRDTCSWLHNKQSIYRNANMHKVFISEGVGEGEEEGATPS